MSSIFGIPKYLHTNFEITYPLGAIWIEIIPAFAFALFIYFYQKHVNTATSGSRALCTGPILLSTSTHWPCYDTVSGSHVLFTRLTNLTFQQFFSLEIGHTILFSHLKIILLQCFQFSISATISSIQTDS